MTTRASAPEEGLRGVARGDLSGIEALVNMHEGVLEASGLDPETYQLVQIAALTALDGSPVSWLVHLEAADESGLGLEKVLGTLVATAPIVGTPKIVSAAANIVRAAGLAEERERGSGT
jgi:4-carboxymuconolactone decarboxylase